MSLWGGLKRLLRGGPRGEAREPDLPSAEELFAAEVEAAVRQLPTVASVTRGDEFSLAVVGHDQQTHTLFLHNIFAETRDTTPDDRAARIRRFLSVIRDPSEAEPSFADARDRLVPLLRNATMFHGIDADQLRTPIRRHFAPFLIECVGIDAEDSIGYVAQSQIEKWGVPAETVFRAAHETAAAAFRDDVRPYGSGRGFALWHVARDDSYESSRLLVPGWLAGFASRVSGRPIAIVPSRSRVIVGGDGNEACLRALVEAAQREFMASPRSVSPALYTIDDRGAVVPLVLAAGHPLAAEVAIGHLSLAATEYKAQEEVLQPKLGEDIFVATYQGIRKGDLVSSFTTWAEDVASLLPEAAEIALVPSTGEHFRVPWDIVMALVGDGLQREPGIDPPRWRTGRWPDEATLARLRAAASG